MGITFFVVDFRAVLKFETSTKSVLVDLSYGETLLSGNFEITLVGNFEISFLSGEARRPTFVHIDPKFSSFKLRTARRVRRYRYIHLDQ
jgi:hypothetical protein